MKDHIEWIDLAKGMLIILVAYGHMGLSGVPVLGEWFASFHMPFFFLVSGLLFNPVKYSSLASFIKRRWATLIRPFFIFSALVLVGYWFLEPDMIVDRIKSVVWNGWGGYALWFIPVLLGTEVCYYLICRWCKKVRARITVIAFLALTGFVCYRLEVPNHWNICFILTSTLFYGLGNILSLHLKTFYVTAHIPRLFIATFVCLAISGCYSFNLPRPEFFINSLGSGVLTHINATSGALFMCSFSVLLSRLRGAIFSAVKFCIKYIGRNSYVVLAFHQMTLHLLSATGMMPNGSVQRLLMWIVLILLIEFITRYTPAVLGRKLVPQVQLT